MLILFKKSSTGPGLVTIFLRPTMMTLSEQLRVGHEFETID